MEELTSLFQIFRRRMLRLTYLGFLLCIYNHLLQAFRVISWFITPSYALAACTLCGLCFSLTYIQTCDCGRQIVTVYELAT